MNIIIFLVDQIQYQPIEMTTLNQPFFDREEAPVSDIKKEVNDKIRSKKVLLFSKSWDPFSTKAKNALAHYSLSSDEYEIWELNSDSRMKDIQYYLGDLTGATSVPRLFINGKFIGGGDKTGKLLR